MEQRFTRVRMEAVFRWEEFLLEPPFDMTPTDEKARIAFNGKLQSLLQFAEEHGLKLADYTAEVEGFWRNYPYRHIMFKPKEEK